MTKLVMVECVSMFRMRYVVEVEDDIDHALDEIVCNDKIKEFSQEYMGEYPFSHREISKEEYLREFDKDNDYIKSWTEEKKLEFINKINSNKS